MSACTVKNPKDDSVFPNIGSSCTRVLRINLDEYTKPASNRVNESVLFTKASKRLGPLGFFDIHVVWDAPRDRIKYTYFKLFVTFP